MEQLSIDSNFSLRNKLPTENNTINYSRYPVNQLRNIASQAGIQNSFFMKKINLIKILEEKVEQEVLEKYIQENACKPSKKPSNKRRKRLHSNREKTACPECGGGKSLSGKICRKCLNRKRYDICPGCNKRRKRKENHLCAVCTEREKIRIFDEARSLNQLKKKKVLSKIRLCPQCGGKILYNLKLCQSCRSKNRNKIKIKCKACGKIKLYIDNKANRKRKFCNHICFASGMRGVKGVYTYVQIKRKNGVKKKRVLKTETPFGFREKKQSGYTQIWTGEKWEQEHRVTMEQMLARKLRKGELVHHRNGKRDDNRPLNLQLLVSQTHSSGHEATHMRDINRLCNMVDELIEKLKKRNREVERLKNLKAFLSLK